MTNLKMSTFLNIFPKFFSAYSLTQFLMIEQIFLINCILYFEVKVLQCVGEYFFFHLNLQLASQSNLGALSGEGGWKGGTNL
jgi:hypothetical protein